MSFSGLHCVCGFIGGANKYEQTTNLLSDVAWTQSMTSPGTTAQCAPDADELRLRGDPSFEIYASADVWVSIGLSPDPVAGNRIYVPAQTTRNIFCKPGDYLAWTFV